MKTIIKCNNLNLQYKNKKILENISFELQENNIVALLGKNGSGKSELLKSIIGMNSNKKGEVYINGFDVHDDFVEAIKKTGIVLSIVDLYNNLTGYQNLKLIADIYDVNENQIMEKVKLLNLESIINEKTENYTISEKKSLMIVRSLLNNPNLLIYDEIFSGLDFQSINIIKKVIFKLKEEKITMIISGHQTSDLKDVCNKYMILEKGKLIEYKNITGKKDLEKIYTGKIEKINKI